MSRNPLALRAPAPLAPCLLAGLALSAPFALQAQPVPALTPVVVIGTREPMPLDRVVGDIVVIDAERIRDSAVDSLEALLAREGGIQFSRNGAAGQSASVLVRGGSASHVVVLVDGVRVGSASLGLTDLAAISLAQIERIEILRGPGSSLYGADAAAGVINIVTRRGAGAPRASLHAAVGQLRASEVDASASGSFGAFDLAAGASREASRGVSSLHPGDTYGYYNPDADGFHRRSLQLRGGWTPVQGHRIGFSVLESRLRSQYDSGNTDPVTWATDPSPDFRNRVDTQVASLDYRGALTERWTTTVTLSGQTDDLTSGDPASASRYRTRRSQLTWQHAFTLAPGQQLVAAVDALRERVIAVDLGAVPTRRNTGVVLGYNGQFGAQRVQIDLRHDDNSVFGGVTTGKVGWAWDVQRGLTLRAVAGTTFRAPTFNDLYYPGYGIATVRPEEGRSVEVGLRWRDGDRALGATLYRNRLTDMIGYQADPTQCPAGYDYGCAGNVSRAQLQGATLSASTVLGAFGLGANVDFFDARNRDTGQRLPRRAAHQETLSGDWTRGPWRLAATVVSVGARPEGGKQLAAYTTLDLHARWRFATRWQVEAKLLNATDRRYEPVLDAQASGRQLFVGMRFDSAGL